MNENQQLIDNSQKEDTLQTMNNNTYTTAVQR